MINLIGIGPGDAGTLTLDARNCLQSCDTVIGYTKYIDLIEPVVETDSVELQPFEIGREKHRAKVAIERACSGDDVSLISSGDAGIYGMGAALFEVMQSESMDSVELEIYPGVSAVNAASALLGAPVGQDFAAISLSDLLTPWKQIVNRVDHAARGDFIISFYNPRSRERADHLSEALDVIRRERDANTPVGLVRDAYRDGENRRIVTLESVPVEEVDMLTTVIVGNSQTRCFDDWMYTPRGYLTEAPTA